MPIQAYNAKLDELQFKVRTVTKQKLRLSIYPINACFIKWRFTE